MIIITVMQDKLKFISNYLSKIFKVNEEDIRKKLNDSDYMFFNFEGFYVEFKRRGTHGEISIYKCSETKEEFESLKDLKDSFSNVALVHFIEFDNVFSKTSDEFFANFEFIKNDSLTEFKTDGDSYEFDNNVRQVKRYLEGDKVFQEQIQNTKEISIGTNDECDILIEYENGVQLICKKKDKFLFYYVIYVENNIKIMNGYAKVIFPNDKLSKATLSYFIIKDYFNLFP